MFQTYRNSEGEHISAQKYAGDTRNLSPSLSTCSPVLPEKQFPLEKLFLSGSLATAKHAKNLSFMPFHDAGGNYTCLYSGI